VLCGRSGMIRVRRLGDFKHAEPRNCTQLLSHIPSVIIINEVASAVSIRLEPAGHEIAVPGRVFFSKSGHPAAISSPSDVDLPFFPRRPHPLQKSLSFNLSFTVQGKSAVSLLLLGQLHR
jgi:hypothetical protein